MWVWALIGVGLLLGCWAIVNFGLAIFRGLGQLVKSLFDHWLDR